MSNVSTLTNLKASVAYKRAGVVDFIRDIESWAAAFEVMGDGLSLSVTDDLADTVTAVKASAGKVYGVLIESPSAASTGVYVQVFNTAAGSVTLGTTAPRVALFCPAGETVAYPIHAAGSANLFGTAISVASTTTPSGSTAPDSADRALVTVFYA